ncbi:MAG: trehalose-6-phosphate synthase [Corynebacterium sp.]|nr:trehalose-6-phosphate synthase [Corynebacterium sp.]
MSTFVVAANRLPMELRDGAWQPSPGGLVSALNPVLEHSNGVWVGSAYGEAPPNYPAVALTSADYENFYEGMCNATLWPLYHDLIVTPQFHQHWWESYVDVNRRFCDTIISVADPGATVWVQDYQLQLVPGMLRAARPDLTIGFFLHIPFPSPDLFHQLPWREEMVRGLAGADLIGFHVERSASNFSQLLDMVEVDRHPPVVALPISIEIPTPATDHQVRALREQLGTPRTLIVGVDRLDYTKGILPRLQALEAAYEHGLRDATMVQIATPSRERVAHYQLTRADVEREVGRINGRFGSLGRPIVHYLHTTVTKDELIALYTAADVMAVTPFKDGMNLVAKEYVSCHPDGSGALVLSEFAGAAEELAQAHLCNPYDVTSIETALRAAIDGLGTPESEAAMTAMYRHIADHDVHRWAREFVDTLAAARHP